jgi:choline dehydrogenase
MNRRLYWPRGRVLGGSSSINAMIYMRGHPQDYFDWASAAGPDWDWPRVRQIFKDLEDNQSLADDHHGQGGPLTVSDLRAAQSAVAGFRAGRGRVPASGQPRFQRRRSGRASGSIR